MPPRGGTVRTYSAGSADALLDDAPNAYSSPPATPVRSPFNSTAGSSKFGSPARAPAAAPPTTSVTAAAEPAEPRDGTRVSAKKKASQKPTPANRFPPGKFAKDGKPLSGEPMLFGVTGPAKKSRPKTAESSGRRRAGSTGLQQAVRSSISLLSASASSKPRPHTSGKAEEDIRLQRAVKGPPGQRRPKVVRAVPSVVCGGWSKSTGASMATMPAAASASNMDRWCNHKDTTTQERSSPRQILESTQFDTGSSSDSDSPEVLGRGSEVDGYRMAARTWPRSQVGYTNEVEVSQGPLSTPVRARAGMVRGETYLSHEAPQASPYRLTTSEEYAPPKYGTRDWPDMAVMQGKPRREAEANKRLQDSEREQSLQQFEDERQGFVRELDRRVEEQHQAKLARKAKLHEHWTKQVFDPIQQQVLSQVDARSAAETESHLARLAQASISAGYDWGAKAAGRQQRRVGAPFAEPRSTDERSAMRAARESVIRYHSPSERGPRTDPLKDELGRMELERREREELEAVARGFSSSAGAGGGVGRATLAAGQGYAAPWARSSTLGSLSGTTPDKHVFTTTGAPLSSSSMAGSVDTIGIESSYKESVSAQGEAAYWQERLAEHKSMSEHEQSKADASALMRRRQMNSLGAIAPYSSHLSSAASSDSSSGYARSTLPAGGAWSTPQRLTNRATGWSPSQLVDESGRVLLHPHSVSAASHPFDSPSAPALSAQERVSPSDYTRASGEIARMHYREPQPQGRQQKTTRPAVDEYRDAMVGLTPDVRRSEHVLQSGSRGKARPPDVNAGNTFKLG